MSWDQLQELLLHIFKTQTGIPYVGWPQLVMWAIGLFFLFLAVAKNIEPLLLVPIGFGIFIVNFPLAPLMGHTEQGTPEFLNFFYHYGLEWEILPSVIFLGLGTLTDFGPMIANPRVLVVGAGAQLGVFITFVGHASVRFLLAGGGFGGNHRRRRWPDHRVPDDGAGPASVGGERGGCLLVHGLGATHPTAGHAPADHEGGATDHHGAAAAGLEDGEDPLPADRRRRHRPAHPGSDAADGHVHARQLHARIRGGASASSTPAAVL